jgi:hypothetical protein
VSYVVERQGAPIANQHFAVVNGSPATAAKQMGKVHLGILAAEK